MKQLESAITKNKFIGKNDTLILAISGGVDSVVLAHLLKKSGYHFHLAHCNFKLRGEESEKDEKFCRDLAEKMNVKIFTRSFDTEEYAARQNLSIQMAARKLRYAWFRDLLKENKLDHVLTAHHANDTVETVFINLLRGSGVNGLKGIAEKNGKIIRPLLNITRSDIETYARKNDIAFREDKSNKDDKYERNFIRLHIVPKLKELKPNLEKTFVQNSFRFRQEAGIVNDFLEQKAKELMSSDGDSLHLDKEKLKGQKYIESIVHYTLKPLGFNRTQQSNIIQNMLNNALVGKKFSSATHELTIDRKEIIIRPHLLREFKEVSLNSLAALKSNPYFKVSIEKTFTHPQKNELFVDENHLVYPLILRSIQTGDKFVPFGMNGFKLLSDFLREEKLNSFEKENCKVLVNGNGEIIWVAGHRSDNRYRVNETGKNLLKLTYLGQ